MQFNSLAFAVFLLVVLAAYRAVGRVGRLRDQNLLLLFSSYFFYGWWDWRFLGLLLVSTVVDYCIGRRMAEHLAATDAPRAPRSLLVLSVTVNLGILGFFKYCDFFLESAAAALAALGVEANLPLLRVVLPVGISFYTFQTIAYTYSVYRREVAATQDLVAFGVYVAYFPQLVAGPIERARHLLPQIETPRVVDRDKVASGAELILLGLFKKIAIADAAAVHVEAVFADPSACSSGTLLLGVYMFALQIYGDFSGYTDIARGVSRLLGIELMLNFRQPYLAADITDFWRRWHISLSTWLREHLYIPLGGNRYGTLKTYRNLMLTMLLGGLWHGAGWNFVIWGGLHGCYLAVHKWMLLRRGTRPSPGPCRWLLGVLLTFHLVCFAWIFFRAKEFDTAWEVVTGLFKFDGFSGQVPATALGLLGLALLMDAACLRGDREVPFGASQPGFVRGLVYGAAVVMMIVADSPGVVPFIYFQF